MAHELEAAQAVSLGGIFRRRAEHTAPPGTPCANCATILMGPWCHVCGQLGEDFHRSWIRLVAESVEGLIHLDGRLWRTLPDLVLRPGRLTRRYLEGHRVPQIPPLRLFLVVLLMVFTVGALTAGKTRFVTLDSDHGVRSTQVQGLTSADKEKVKAEIEKAHISVAGDRNGQFGNWIRTRVERVVDDPDLFALVLETWAERFAVLMLPISALLLSALFIFQRRFYLFDHMIFSLHSLSFLGLFITVYLLAASTAAVAAPKAHDPLGWLLLALPVHLFAHMRGVYGTSILGTLLRMFLLFVGSLVGFVALMIGLVFVGLANL